MPSRRADRAVDGGHDVEVAAPPAVIDPHLRRQPSPLMQLPDQVVGLTRRLVADPSLTLHPQQHTAGAALGRAVMPGELVQRLRPLLDRHAGHPTSTTSGPSWRAPTREWGNTFGAIGRSARRHATATARISTSASTVARIAMKCRHAR